jgi:putative oxidoreductase
MTARIDTGALLLGRLALAACVAPSGIAHAMNISGFAVLLAKQGLPFAPGLATAGVLIEVFGPLAVVLGLAPRLSAPLLVLVEGFLGFGAAPVLGHGRSGPPG